MKVIFLDRDGVINIDTNYTYKISDFVFVDGVFNACKEFNEFGYKIIIVTNQSGIGRGYYNLVDFEKLTDWMLSEFKSNNIDILDVFYCPHKPEDLCKCRKPKPGMIDEALNKYKIDLNQSWLIGDKQTDIETAINAKIPNRILITDSQENKNSYVAKSLFDTIPIIINEVKDEI